jgi:hypothetical protein
MTTPVPETATNSTRPTRVLVCAAIALVLFKLWLVAGQTMMALGSSPHDDRLFLNLAANLLQGEWLGDYTDKTLAKGPFYSMFIAAVFALGVPLLAAKHLLYAAACAVMVKALQPLRLGAAFAFVLFAILLFNPVTYDTGHHVRVLRQAIIPLLSLFILAGATGLAVRHDASPRRQLPWAVLLGATLSCFWITREESVWILPAVALPLAWLAWRTWQCRPAAAIASATWPRRLAVLLLPLALWPLAPLAVATLNLHHYGVFTTCEFKVAEFKAAYGALTRVTPSRWHPHIPVARETRERIYAVSPAFAELRPLLDGWVGDNWAINSQGSLGLPLEEREISGGGFMWALRDAVQHAGLSPDAKSAMAYYARLADEVNAACDAGLLEAGPRRVTMLPPLVPAYRPLIRDSLVEGLRNAITLDGFLVKPRPSRDEIEKRAFFADLTRARLSPAPGDPQLLVAQPILDRIRVRLLGGILAGYRVVIPWAAALSVAVWLATAALALRRRHLPLLLPLGVGAAGSALAVVLIAALVDATSFAAVHPGYLSGFYGLYLLVIALAWPGLRATTASS